MLVISIQPGRQPSHAVSRGVDGVSEKKGLRQARAPRPGCLPFSQPSTVSSLIAWPVA